MKVVVIADAYPPMKTSGAVQIRDLVAELFQQGHEVTVLLPDSKVEGFSQDSSDGIQVVRLQAPETKDVNYVRRAIAEFMLSHYVYRNLQKSPLKGTQWDAVIWYSPTIFWGALVNKIKAASKCPAYLILRDIFPEWAVDMGLLNRGLIYRYFKRMEKYQYRQANVIGVQTPSNLEYFRNQQDLPCNVEVLNNWLRPASPGHCSIALSSTRLAGRKNFVYTGNIGIAQGMEILIELAAAFNRDSSTGFVFVGRGTALERIRQMAQARNLENILFYDEIPPEEIPGLLKQASAGLIALDPRHRNDNIPGKFLAYMQAGLPVLANINPGNDLETLIYEREVGEVVTSNSLDELISKAHRLLSSLDTNTRIAESCKQLARDEFSAEAAVKQITKALVSVEA
jgi:glycosyltransferase involved in cell wall biosynthesis